MAGLPSSIFVVARLQTTGFGRYLPRVRQFLDARLSDGAHRFSAIPHSIRRKKDKLEWVDLTRQEEKQTRRSRVFCDTDRLTAPEAELSIAETEVALYLHHARARHLLLQRAVAREQAAKAFGLAPEEAGAFFSYQAIRAGQVFQGEIRGAPDLLKQLADLVKDGTVLRLGRSKGAQYGATAVWRRIDPPAPIPLTAATKFTVILESPLIALSPKTGHPIARFPLEEFQSALDAELKMVRQYVRVEWQGGYLSHQQLPRQQMLALAPGSVFVLEGNVTNGKLTAAAQRSYGSRREQGYGAIRIVPRESVTQQRISTPAANVKPSAEIANGEAKRLAENLFRETVQQTARQEAFEAHYDSVNIPTKALLHRLRGMLLAQSGAEFQASLGQMRERAQNQLNRCRIRGTRLSEILKQNWAKLAESRAQAVYAREPWKSVLANPPVCDASIGRLYLSELLAAAAQRKGKE
jgi:hypothetical protein